MEEKRKLSGKTVLKIIGAVVSALIFALYVYAGLSGAEGMQKKVRVMQRGDMKVWLSGCLSSSLIFALCFNSALNDMKIWMWRKKMTFPLILLAFAPFLAVFFLDAYRDLGIAGIVSVFVSFGVLFGIAWIPPLLNILLARGLEQKGERSGKQLMHLIEWIHFYPLKKLLLLGLWGFGVFLLLRAVWLMAAGALAMDGEMVFFLCFIAVLVTVFFKRIKKYVGNPYHCAPVLNSILTKRQLEELMEGERFERMVFQDKDMDRYVRIYRSRNWMVINGRLFSRKLALKAGVERGNGDSTVKVLYLNGQIAKTKIPLDVYFHPEFETVEQELTGISTPLILKNRMEQVGQRFQELFPGCDSERERVYALLSHDAGQIKQDYAAFFAPQPKGKKKKKEKNG